MCGLAGERAVLSMVQPGSAGGLAGMHSAPVPQVVNTVMPAVGGLPMQRMWGEEMGRVYEQPPAGCMPDAIK